MLKGKVDYFAKSRLLVAIRNNNNPASLFPSLAIGIVIWMMALLMGASFSALIFQGRLTGYFASGIGMFLVAAVSLHVLTAFLGSDTATIPTPQSTAAVILGAISVNLVALAPADMTDETLYITLIATIVLSSLLTGLFFLALGGWRVANIVRYIPYPVIGGFLAGTGWLLVQGSLQVVVNMQLRLDTVSRLLQGEQIVRWLPGLIMTMVILVLLRRTNNILAFPAVIITALVLVYGLLHLGDALNDPQWFLADVTDDINWQRIDLAMLSKIDVQLVLSQAAGIAALIVFSTSNVLLNVSGLELVFSRELDFNRELVVAGAGNMLGSLFGGGIAGFPTLSYSALVHRTGSNGRLVNLALGILLASTLLFGTSFVVLFPRAILGGVLMYLGGSFLVEWLYDAYFKIPKLDYLVVVLILLVIAAFGLLWGMAVGILVSILLFVLKYSQILVIRQEFPGNVFRSSTDRSVAENLLLRELGDRVLVFRLQGYIFFGTGFQLVQRVRARILRSEPGHLKFIILDFRLASGMDISTVVEFTRLRQLAQSRGIQLLLANASSQLLAVLRSSRFLPYQKTIPSIFDDLDHAIQWCEDQLLAQGNLSKVTRVTIEEQLSNHPMIRRQDIDTLFKYLETVEAPVGEHIANQGDVADSLYLIESGRVDILLRLENGRVRRLRSMTAGTIVGEVGFYLDRPRSATIIVTETAVVQQLTRAALHQMEKDDAPAAIAFHSLVSCVLSGRLTTTNHMVEALMN